MDDLVESGDDVLGEILNPRLPSDPLIRSQLLEAYRVLRLDHQIHFFAWKLSPEDKTFMGLSSLALLRITEQLSSAVLLIALALSVARLPLPTLVWAPLAAVVLAIVGVSVATWRGGLALEAEHEHYQKMRQMLKRAIERWETASDDDRRFEIAKTVEHCGLEELRSFIALHEKAQFLL